MYKSPPKKIIFMFVYINKFVFQLKETKNDIFTKLYALFVIFITNLIQTYQFKILRFIAKIVKKIVK